jgi:hypothetical protein
LETTGQVNGLLPLMGACAAAYFVSFFLMKGSIMTEKIKRRGVKTPDSYEPDILQNVIVKDLLTETQSAVPGTHYVYTTDDAGLAAEIMGKYNKEMLPVLDNKNLGKVVGVITAASILQYYSSEKQKEHQYESPRKTREIMVTGRKLAKKAYRSKG